MRDDVIEGLASLVTSVMFVVVAIFAMLCLLLILRVIGKRPYISSSSFGKEKTPKEKEDDRRRRHFRLWFWDRRDPD